MVRKSSTAPDPNAPETQEQEIDPITVAIDELGGEFVGYVCVFKHDPGRAGSRTGWGAVGRYTISDFDPWQIPRDYGAGLYKFDFLREGGKGKAKSVQQRFIEPKTPGVSINEPKAASPQQGGGLGSDRFMEFMLERSSRAEEMQGQLMVAIIGALAGGRSGGSDIGAGDLLKAIEIGRADSKSPMPHEMLAEALQTGMKLGAKLNGKEEGDGMQGLVPKALGLLDRIMSNPAAGRQAPPQAPPARNEPQAPAIAAPAPQAQQETQNQPQSADPLVGALAYLAPEIIRGADANLDAYSFGTSVVYMASQSDPDGWRPIFERLIGASDAELAELCNQTGVEGLAARVGWMRAACEGISDALGLGDDSSTEPEPSKQPEGKADDAAVPSAKPD